MNTPTPPPSHRSTRYPSTGGSRPGESTASNVGGPDGLREHARRDSAYGEPIVFGLDKFGLIVVSLVLTVFVGFMVSLVLIYRPSSTAHPAPPLPSSTATSAPTPTASPTPTLTPELAAQREAAYSVAPPEENPQMFTNTDEGGAATAAYFVRLMGYSYVSGNTDLIQEISDPECQFCASVVETAQRVTRDGRWVDPYEITISDIEWDPPYEARPFGFAEFEITQKPQTMHKESGETINGTEEQSRLSVGLYWNGERWIVRGVTVNE